MPRPRVVLTICGCPWKRTSPPIRPILVIADSGRIQCLLRVTLVGGGTTREKGRDWAPWIGQFKPIRRCLRGRPPTPPIICSAATRCQAQRTYPLRAPSPWGGFRTYPPVGLSGSEDQVSQYSERPAGTAGPGNAASEVGWDLWLERGQLGVSRDCLEGGRRLGFFITRGVVAAGCFLLGADAEADGRSGVIRPAGP